MAKPNDYRETLNLPRTEFPMRANLAKREFCRAGMSLPARRFLRPGGHR